MPGILPMKVIKVGTSSQSRIAQACDRCRSKKIRCDGIRPCCSQCANVGFECRTSDKLSRRAFPRGYTESLEERVRQLETENRELKDLLDEKDEKIDMLSKMHGNNPRKTCTETSSSPTPVVHSRKDAALPAKEDTFRAHASPLLLGVENSDSYFMGASSGRAFIEAFKRKIQESGKPCSDFNPEVFLHIQGTYPLTAQEPLQSMRIPPRMFTDRCVNIYFQEWAPLFPVLHKPSFLRIYEDYVSDPEKTKNNQKLVQLYLVFCIAGLSSEHPDLEQVAACEQQWQRSLDAIIMENTMNTLQCLVLALMYCTVRADYKRLQHYKGVAVGLSHRLGLHQSQKRFSFGALTIETRKKVFWTLYTLDCFSAAILGLPKLLKEDDIHAEYPSDTDDEYVTEKGFQPSLPGEHTRLSSALALFKGTRILAKVLERNYPAATSHELSLQQMGALEAELDHWCENLPQHLKLTFRQDKPSTDVTGSRSPLLALAYYYTKTLIYRPAVGSSLGSKAAPALISISESSKHMVQIIQLLEERNMSLAFCLNKADLLVLCGMTLLYQSVDLKHDSKVMKDNTRLANAVIKIVEKAKAPGSLDFKRVAAMLIPVDEAPQQQVASSTSLPTPPRQSPDACRAMPAPPRSSPPTSHAHHVSHNGNLIKDNNNNKPHPLGRHASASMSETDLLLQQEKLRRMAMSTSMDQSRQSTELQGVRPRPSFDGIHGSSESLPLGRRQHRLSLAEAQAAQASMVARVSPAPGTNSKQNLERLDYLSFSSPPARTQPLSPASPVQARSQQSQNAAQAHIYSQLAKKEPAQSAAEWEALVGSLDSGAINLYDAIYGGHGVPLTETPITAESWSPDAWDLTHFNIGDFGDAAGTAQSVLSVSEESLSSADDLPAHDLPVPNDMGLGLDTLDYHASQMMQPIDCYNF